MPGLNAVLLGGISGPGGIGGALAGAAADSLLSAVVGWVSSAAASVLAKVGALVAGTSAPDLGAAWFASNYALMAMIAGSVALPLVLVSLGQAIVRQDGSVVVRSVLVHLPLAALLTAAAMTVVRLGLAIVDAMCREVIALDHASPLHVLDALARVVQEGNQVPAVTPFMVLMVAVLLVAGALVLWIELLVRTAAVHVAVLFLPLALVGTVWPATSGWARRLAHTLGALVVSKFVIVAVLGLAASAVVGANGPTGLGGLFGGVALVVLATLAPFAVLKIIPFVEAGAVSHLEGVGRNVSRRVVSSGYRAGRTAVGLGARAAAGAGGGDGDDGAGVTVAGAGDPTERVGLHAGGGSLPSHLYDSAPAPSAPGGGSSAGPPAGGEPAGGTPAGGTPGGAPGGALTSSPPSGGPAPPAAPPGDPERPAGSRGSTPPGPPPVTGALDG